MSENNSIKRYSLSKQVADQLEQDIESGKYKIGEKIPTEIELMGTFEVSRNTIREAVQALTSAGILVVKQGDGTYVKSTNRFNACMNSKYEKVSIDDITEARNALELAIVQLAAKRRTKKDVDHIISAFNHLREIHTSVHEDAIADFEFHKTIAKACHNAIIYDLYMSISSFIQEQITLQQEKFKGHSEYSDHLHEDLYHAILDQDAEKARVCMEKFIKL